MPSDAISSIHCTIRANGDALEIIDEDSTNGTFVDGESIGRQPASLTVGSRITLARAVELVVEQWARLDVEEILKAAPIYSPHRTSLVTTFDAMIALSAVGLMAPILEHAHWPTFVRIGQALSLELDSPEWRAENTPDPAEPVRAQELSGDLAAQTVAAFEQPLGSLVALSHDAQLTEWDEEFIRNSIRQIELWRERDSADPQIFELLVRDIVLRLLSKLLDPQPLERQLLALGADDQLAADIGNKVVTAVEQSLELGNNDAAVDGRALDRLADSADRIAVALETATLDPQKSLARRLSEATALGAAGTVGKEAAALGLRVLRNTLSDQWTRLQVGLVLAWRLARDWILK